MQAHFESILAEADCSFVYRRSSPRGFPFLWHFHPEHELTLIGEGNGRRFVGDHIGEFGPGDVVFLGKNLPHTWYSPPAEGTAQKKPRSVVIQFNEVFLGEGFFNRPEMSRVRALFERGARGLQFTGQTRQAVAQRLDEMRHLDPCGRLVELLSILDLLARSTEVMELSSAAFTPSLRTGDRQRMDEVSRFVNEHYTRSLPLEEVASRARMSPSAFSRFFRKASGKTFTGYVNELRVGTACRMLIESDRTISQAAFAVGFNNLSNFNRRFRELKGVSPKAYRREYLARPTIR